MKILVVDDEPGIRALCCRALEAEGYQTSSEATGEAAAKRLAEDWDIVLTDITMPGGVDGIELCRQVRARGSADVLLMTGFPEMETTLAALRQGAYDYIIKPFSPGTLVTTVKRCADKRQLSVELAREKFLRAELEKAHFELARMQKIRDAFGQFVTPEVAQWLMARPEGHWRQGARKVVTVLFTDVRRFTPFASEVPPEDVVKALNEIFTCIVGAVQEQGGIVNKFIGDGLLALFGVPLELEGHAEAAARAALAMRDRINALADARRKAGLPGLQIGIGINTGEAVAGCLGTDTRAEYSVIGHAVNLAARLEQNAEPGKILLGPDTARRLESEFACRLVGDIALAGILKSVQVHELVGPGALSASRAASPVR
jgi:adenylate cyclase